MSSLVDAYSPSVINKHRGRPRGSQNKTSETMRWGFVEAYRQLGGVDGLVKWGKRKPDLFYPMLKALLPHELAESGLAGGITIVIKGREAPNHKPLEIPVVQADHQHDDAEVIDPVDGSGPKQGV